MNTVILIGRLTKDIELKYTETQLPITRFPIAINREGNDNVTDFLNIVVFGKQAENCERYLSKGRKVAIQGSIQTSSYVNKEGNKVYTTEVVANRVEFLDWGNQSKKEVTQQEEDNMTLEEFKDEDIPF